MAAGGVKERVLEFLAQYGERGYAVLRAALEAALAGGRGRGVRLGDFSHREVAARLKAWGIEYNPSMLLRILERDYGVIETSYRSGNQHWWKFLDKEAVVEALDEYDRGTAVAEEDEDPLLDIDDPEVELFRVQVASLDLPSLLEELRRLSAKPKLTRAEMARLRSIAFGELENVVTLIRRAEELGYDGPEVEMLREALVYASRLSRRLLAAGRSSFEAKRSIERLAKSGSRSLLGP